MNDIDGPGSGPATSVRIRKPHWPYFVLSCAALVACGSEQQLLNAFSALNDLLEVAVPQVGMRVGSGG